MALSSRGWGLILVVLAPLIIVSISSIVVGQAFGQEAQQMINRRVEIWALFYRGMVAAFVVGAVVQGSIIYVGWRFREGNKKNQPREPMGGAHR
jgi:heme/copper-type cytochrome/quinol oxidase subunit 2